jgi:hypothetical protein
MKITVELSDSEMGEITRLTGLRKKGPAIRKMLTDALVRRRRAEISTKFLTGEWSAELAGFEQSKVNDHTTSTTLSEIWRD